MWNQVRRAFGHKVPVEAPKDTQFKVLDTRGGRPHPIKDKEIWYNSADDVLILGTGNNLFHEYTRKKVLPKHTTTKSKSRK